MDLIDYRKCFSADTISVITLIQNRVVTLFLLFLNRLQSEIIQCIIDFFIIDSNVS